MISLNLYELNAMQDHLYMRECYCSCRKIFYFSSCLYL
jgi:hypothetical protein